MVALVAAAAAAVSIEYRRTSVVVEQAGSCSSVECNYV